MARSVDFLNAALAKVGVSVDPTEYSNWNLLASSNPAFDSDDLSAWMLSLPRIVNPEGVALSVEGGRMKFVATVAGFIYAGILNTLVVPGQVYTWSFDVQADAAAAISNQYPIANFYKSDGTTLTAQLFLTYDPDPVIAPVRRSLTVTAPPESAVVDVFVCQGTAAIGDIHWVDNVQLVKGTAVEFLGKSSMTKELTKTLDATPAIIAAAAEVGIILPQTGDELYELCASNGTILGLDTAEYIRGALLFEQSSGARHVGISVGNGEVIEARRNSYAVVDFGARRWSDAALIPGMVY